MKKVYDLAVKVGTYQKDGQTKNKYTGIGSIIEKDDGGRFMLLDPMINLAAVPREANRDMVMVSMFEPKEKPSSNNETPGGFGE